MLPTATERLGGRHVSSYTANPNGLSRCLARRTRHCKIYNFLQYAISSERYQPQVSTIHRGPSVCPAVEDDPMLMHSAAEDTPCSTQSSVLSLSWAGSGLYFFWQLGAMKYLATRYDLTQVHMSGSSGGSLAAVLAACRVPADKVLNRAFELSAEFGILERPMGLTGVWGQIVEQWLDELLPPNAHEVCRGRITVIVTTLPDMRQVGISDFKDRQDLINACMASCHVPLMLDLKVTRPCRGKECVDGSFPDFFYGNCDLLTRGGGAVVFDYFYDKDLKRQGRMDMLQLTSHEELLERVEVGYRYAQRLHEEGAFDRGFTLEEVQLPENGHMREGFVRNDEGGVSVAASASAALAAAGSAVVAACSTEEAADVVSRSNAATRTASMGAGAVSHATPSEGGSGGDASAAGGTSLGGVSLLAGVAGLLGGLGKSGSRAVAMAATKKQQ